MSPLTPALDNGSVFFADDLLGECPHWDEERGVLSRVDVHGGLLRFCDPVTGVQSTQPLEAPVGFAGLASAASLAAGARAATLLGAGCGAICFGFGDSTGVDSEASFAVSTGGDSEASFGASICGAGATACGAAAAKRSLNNSDGDAIDAGAEITGAGSGSAARIVSTAGALRIASTDGRLVTAASKFPTVG